MRTIDQIIADGKTLSQNYTTHKGVSNVDSLMIVSSAQHILQSKTKGAVRRDVDLDFSDLDANGGIDKTEDFRTVIDIDYFPVGATAAFEVDIVPYGTFRKIKRDIAQGMRPQLSCEYLACDHGWRLYFFPFDAISGTLRLHAVPELPEYSAFLGSQTTGYWANWNANIDAYMATRGLEPEFEPAMDGIVCYVAARLLDKIPAARIKYENKYHEWMAKWERCHEAVLKAKNLHAIRGHKLPSALRGI